VGIAEVARTRRDGPPIVIWFDPPAADLLGADLGEWTDDQIAALSGRGDAQLNKT
jgi:hypothetical protein